MSRSVFTIQYTFKFLLALIVSRIGILEVAAHFQIRNSKSGLSFISCHQKLAIHSSRADPVCNCNCEPCAAVSKPPPCPKKVEPEAPPPPPPLPNVKNPPPPELEPLPKLSPLNLPTSLLACGSKLSAMIHNEAEAEGDGVDCECNCPPCDAQTATQPVCIPQEEEEKTIEKKANPCDSPSTYIHYHYFENSYHITYYSTCIDF